ncbi:hypothetical protein FV222_18650 [Methylobacterium sp. WL103]|uniref:hypothetical protein n=1 Tax=Methylobacterium sp. WL103 TaxID=2603891 RepID=UPI0011C8CC63|nr:hypothetical protein [Methylobacterium sp. WL103]TXM96262.1 hypothetical protein FV222_18650 [Methylobacterium sp. WL103]
MALSPEMMKLIKGAKNRFSRGGGKTVKIKEGKTTVRILQTELQFYRELGVHWIKDEAGKVTAVVGCSDVVYGRPCPIDAAIEKAAKVASDDAMVKLIAEWKTRKSVLLKALIRDGSDGSPDPQILEVTPTTFGSIMAMVEEYGSDTDPFDADEGMDFIITRSGKGKDTEYKVMPKLKGAERVTKDQMAKAKELDLDAFIEKEFFRGDENKALTSISEIAGISLAIAPPARAAGLLTGKSASVADDTDDSPLPDERPATKPAARRPAPAPVAEIEEVEPEEEVVEVKPAPKAAPKAAAKPAPVAVEDDADLQGLLDDLDD